MRVCAEKGTKVADSEATSRSRRPCFSFASTTTLRPSGVSSGSEASWAASASSSAVTPGAGATQRLPRTIGKSKAMDLLLTARTIDAAEAERIGIVSRVVSADQLIAQALEAANTIAAMPLSVAMMIKDAVNRAFETTLTEGVNYERRLFHAAFGTPAQREGMSAFLEKRLPKFEGL